MKSPTVRRFTAFQIALHWGQGLLYMALLGTGGAILFRRLLGFQTLPGSALPTFHRWAGITLAAFLGQMLLLSLVTRQFSKLWRDIADCLLFRPRDLIWLLKVPLNAIRPRVALPPAGRFNAGQKLHGAFVFLAVLAFIATGLIMTFAPGMLTVWYIHAALFFGAAAFLLLHVFLSTINPSTRVALKGIFTGHVPRAYAESHHELWAGSGPAQPHAPAVSLRAAALATAIVVAAATAAVLSVGPRRVGAALVRVVETGGDEAVLPGPLARAHAGIANCYACHDALRPPQSADCLACHKRIAGILAAGQGYHGSLRGACRQCHREHQGRDVDLRPLDAAAFNHQRARFNLHGKHQQVACAACHTQRDATGNASGSLQYTGLAFAGCDDCHRNPHPGPEAGKCAGCHTERGWDRKYVVFDHIADTRFPLEGKHATAPCQTCHGQPATPADGEAPAGFVLSGLGRRCADCHRSPHPGQVAADCARCHTEAGWDRKQIPFDHDRDTRFVLEGKHATAPCKACHGPDRPRGGAARAGLATPANPLEFVLSDIGTGCADCHADPHAGQLDSDCERCHNPAGWTGREVAFRHNTDSRFPLRGAHAEVPCIRCHTPPTPKPPLAAGRFRGMRMDCAGCHKDPHSGQLGGYCAACHQPSQWKRPGLLFVHNRDSRFKLDAIHKPLACSACHTGQGPATVYRPLPVTCEQCHTGPAGAIAGRGGGSVGKPDPHAGEVACTDCHHPTELPGRSARYAAACATCHNEHYRGLYFDWSRSLAQRAALARQRLAALAKTNPAAADALARRIVAAEAVGLHNVQLARKLWDQLLEKNPATKPGASEAQVR